MNEDTISRQKAVEKLRRNKSLFCKNRVEFQMLSETDKSRVDEIDTCITELLNLPSAQPDIILCPNCRYNDGTAYCELHYRDVKAKDFCSWAERRE